MRRIWHDYGLSIALGLLFLASWVGHGVFNWFEILKEAESHGQPFQQSDYWIDFFTRTLENWQSEFLQLLTMVTLTSFLIHKGSSESRDGQDQMQQSLDRIEKQLQTLRK